MAITCSTELIKWPRKLFCKISKENNPSYSPLFSKLSGFILADRIRSRFNQETVELLLLGKNTTEKMLLLRMEKILLRCIIANFPWSSLQYSLILFFCTMLSNYKLPFLPYLFIRCHALNKSIWIILTGGITSFNDV